MVHGHVYVMSGMRSMEVGCPYLVAATTMRAHQNWSKQLETSERTATAVFSLWLFAMALTMVRHQTLPYPRYSQGRLNGPQRKRVGRMRVPTIL